MIFSTTTLPYLADTHPLLDQLSLYPNRVALESSNHEHPNGRWSIISAAPAELIELFDKRDIASTIQHLDDLSSKLPKPDSDLPFTGGLIGHISYDLGITDSQQDTLPYYPNQPLILCGFYTWAFLIDHKLKQSHLIYWSEVSSQSRNDLLAIFDCALNKQHLSKSSFQLTTPFKSHWNKEEYKEKIEQILAYILSGDTYQVNLAQMFSGRFHGAPLDAYVKIKDTAKVPFASYFESSNWSFASASPELFLQCEENIVTTKPIKGTRPRHDNPDEDHQQSIQLQNSAKDKAENLMIVDLLRNDLSKNSTNVRVEQLIEIESFSTVHHLVSTIKAKANNSIVKLLMDAFPGGSITGAPKKRSMEIITELEQSPRSFYCGSSFYFSSNGKMNSNILIRGFLFEEQKVTCWAGGGIVADSKWEEEYQESLDKISKLMQAIS